MFSINTFYKSNEWTETIKLLKYERTARDGILYCEHCGKPIIKAYDCIAHHVTELTEENVNDYEISLNPKNIKLIHHKCHNEIHERFGYNKRKVYIVYGPPCSGKTTWVQGTAGKNDLILDIDSIWDCISNTGRYAKPDALKRNVFMVRDCILDMIRTRTGNWTRAYIIGGYPQAAERERLRDVMGAELVYIEEEKDQCLIRAAESGRAGWEKYIEEWFERYIA